MSETFIAAVTARAADASISSHSVSEAPVPLEHITTVPKANHNLRIGGNGCEDREHPGRERPGRDHPGRELPSSEHPGRERPSREHPGRERLNRGNSIGAVKLTDVLLGTGATGKVWLAHFGLQRVEVAAKVVQRADLQSEELQWIRNEMSIHKTLRHPNIVLMYGAFETATTFIMVLSVCRGGSVMLSLKPRSPHCPDPCSMCSSSRGSCLTRCYALTMKAARY